MNVAVASTMPAASAFGRFVLLSLEIRSPATEQAWLAREAKLGLGSGWILSDSEVGLARGSNRNIRMLKDRLLVFYISAGVSEISVKDAP